jgi:hypothetical protein
MYKSAEFIEDDDDDEDEEGLSVLPRPVPHDDSSSVQKARGSGARVLVKTTEHQPGRHGIVESYPKKNNDGVDSDAETPAAPRKTRGRQKVVLDSDDENDDGLEPDTVSADMGGKEKGSGKVKVKVKGNGSGRKTTKGTTDAREKRRQEGTRKAVPEPEITPRPEFERDVAVKVSL